MPAQHLARLLQRLLGPLDRIGDIACDPAMLMAWPVQAWPADAVHRLSGHAVLAAVCRGSGCR